MKDVCILLASALGPTAGISIQIKVGGWGMFPHGDEAQGRGD